MKNLLKTCVVLAGALFLSNPSYSQTLPPGEIGTVTANTPNTWQTFTYTFTPSQTGANFIGFAFRQDPAFWTFDNVSLVVQGTTTNLLTNGAFNTGGSFSVTTTNGPSSIQAPTNWGVWYQNGTYPAAAGTWTDIGGTHGGVWYDGAVGTFDGIYQGVVLQAGTTYTISFEVSGNNTANTSSIQLGVYGGACADVSIAAAGCTIPASVGFTTLATPAQGAAAGGPTGPVAINNPSGTTANNPAGTTTLDVTNAGTYTNDGINGDVNNTGTFTNNSTGTAGNITNAGTLTNNGTVGAVTNSGTMTNNGIAGDVNNTGTFTNSITGTIANLISALFFTNDGTITGTVTNNQGGTFNNNGTVQGATTNAGDLTNTGTLSSLNNSGTANNSGTISGDTVNSGTFTNSGTTGSITNNGNVINTGTTGAVTNNISGTFNNNVGGTTGAVVNAGAWINRGTVATVNNTGTFTNHSTGTTGAVNNTGTFNSTGISGAITNSGISTISGNGSIASANNTGTLNITGAASSGDIFNLAGGLLDFNGTGNIANVDNAGTFNVAGSGAVTSIVNSGIVNFNTAGATVGNITNTGVLNLATAGGNFTAAGYSQTSSGLTAIAGLQQFNINGPAALGGSLMIINSPTAFGRYPLMTAQSLSGTYDSLTVNPSIEPLGAYLKYRDNNVLYYVTPSPVSTRQGIDMVKNDQAKMNNIVTGRTGGALGNDCVSSGNMGGCIGFSFGTTKNASGDLRTGSMVVSTRLGQVLSDNYRIGIFLDKPFTNPTIGTVRYKDIGPIVGGFIGWNQNLNNSGLGLVASVARNDTGNYVISRPQLVYAEAGSAIVPIYNTAYQVKASYSVPVYGSLIATPYLGIRYSDLTVKGYIESGPVFPLSINEYRQTKTDLLGGVSFAMPVTDKITASVSAGVVHNLASDVGSITGHSEIYRLHTFDIQNPGKKYTSGALGAGVSYEFIPNHRVGVNVGWQQKSLIDANIGSIGATYSYGF